MAKLISHLALVMALCGFSVSSGLFLHAFPQPVKRRKVQSSAFVSFTVSVVLIWIALFCSFFGPYYSQSSGLVLIAAMGVITIFSHSYFKIKTMGLFVSPLATLVLAYLAVSYPRHSHHVEQSPPGLFASFHIGVSVLGVAFGISAFAVSLLYLFQQRALKKKLFNFLSSATPPLDKLENSLMFTLWAGLACFTLGVITGAIYLGFFVQGSISGIVWKVVWAIFVWFWYLMILLAKNVLGRSGSVIARMSLVGFVILLGFFFGLDAAREKLFG